MYVFLSKSSIRGWIGRSGKASAWFPPVFIQIQPREAQKTFKNVTPPRKFLILLHPDLDENWRKSSWSLSGPSHPAPEPRFWQKNRKNSPQNIEKIAEHVFIRNFFYSPQPCRLFNRMSGSPYHAFVDIFGKIIGDAFSRFWHFLANNLRNTSNFLEFKEHPKTFYIYTRTSQKLWKSHKSRRAQK